MVLHSLLDALKIAVGIKINPSAIETLKSSGKCEMPYRFGSLEEFGTNLVYRRPYSSSLIVFDVQGNFKGRITNTL